MNLELENIPPDMSLAELAERTQQSLDTLNHLLKKNPNLRVADILMPDPNSPQAEVRRVMFDIFHRVAKAMGRNSKEAAKFDAKARLAYLGESIQYNPPLGRGSKLNPVVHIQDVIEPMLDEDMKAYAYDMGTYRIPLMMNFYNTLAGWRSRGKDVGKVK